MKNFSIAVKTVPGMAMIFLVCGCASVSQPGRTAPEQSGAFTFVVMGDNRPPASAKDQFRQPPYFYRAIKEINLLDPDFVIIVGDLIRGYTDDEEALGKMWDGFDAAAARFRMPYYQVIGNHDVNSAMMQRAYLERYGERFPLFYSFDHQGCHLIVLDSDLHDEYDNITGEQLAWLKNDLKRHQDARKLFVFLHKPLWKYENSNWMKEVHPFLARYGVDTVFCGHWHLYTKHATLDGVRYVVTGGAGAELSGSDFTGGFYHYCLVTVRGERTSLAVARTGHIEDEEIVNEELWEKFDAFDALLRPISLRLERGAARIPERFEMVITNPFNEALSGTLVWELPPGSPWRMPTPEVAISVEPGEKQKVIIPVPPGGSPANIGTLAPFPVGIWNLSVGDRTLWKNRRAVIVIDRWPYREVRTLLKKAASMDGVEKIVAASEVSVVLAVPWENSTGWQLRETMTWRFPEGCRWKITPGSAVIDLAPEEKREVRFSVSLAGSLKEIFPLPKLGSVVKLDGEEILRVSTHLPIDAREYFTKERRLARCLRVETAPEIDGKLDDPAWQKCEPAADFLPSNACDRTNYPTEARLAYDRENLYMSFRCYEPNIFELVTRAKERDGKVWRDDSVEVFLDTNLDRKTYYHYVFNANAVMLDAIVFDSGWNGSCTARAGREREAWTLEVALPWKTIGMEEPSAGTRMGLQLAHTARKRPREITQWSSTFGGNHVPSRFGVLILE